MGAVGAVAAMAVQTYGQNRSLIKQGEANRKTAQGYVRSMNYSLQNLERQRQDAFEAAVDDMERVNLQGHRVASGVDNAVNEGMMGGGRTANLLKRNAQADLARTINSIQTNYTKKRNEIDVNKEATVLDTKNAISSIQDVQKPSLLGTLFNLGTAYIGGLEAAEQIKLLQEKAGVGVSNPTKASGAATTTQNLAGLFGSTTPASFMPKVPTGNYSISTTYDELFGNTNYKTGLFYNTGMFRNWNGKYPTLSSYDSLYGNTNYKTGAFYNNNMFGNWKG